MKSILMRRKPSETDLMAFVVWAGALRFAIKLSFNGKIVLSEDYIYRYFCHNYYKIE